MPEIPGTVHNQPVAHPLMAAPPVCADEAAETPATRDRPPLLQPILYALPMQLLAYLLATGEGHSVDRTRHLARAVTC